MAPRTRPSRMPTWTSVAFTNRSTSTCVVEREAALDRLRQLGQVRRPWPAPTDEPSRRGLTMTGNPKLAVHVLELVEVGPRRDVVRRRRHVVEAEHLLGLELVHGQRAREHAAAGVRDAQQLEQALDAAVLAAAPVEREEDDVDAAARSISSGPGPSGPEHDAARPRARATRAPPRRPRPSAARPRAPRSVRPISTPTRFCSSWDPPRKVSLQQARQRRSAADKYPRSTRGAAPCQRVRS